MSYITYIEVNEKGEVTYQNSNPFDPVNGLGKTMGELLTTGYLIDPIQPPQQIQGKTPILMWDGSKVYYRYDEVTVTEGDEIKAVRNDLDKAILELSMLIGMQQGGS